MSDGNGKTTLLETLKTILQSQVGGWVIACLAFGAMAYWIIKDREIVYQDIHNLRDKAMPMILETKAIAEEARDVSTQNNAILSEIRSYMQLPLENRSDLKAIRKQLDRLPKEGAVDNINQ